jgi:hypothetical protein
MRLIAFPAWNAADADAIGGPLCLLIRVLTVSFGGGLHPGASSNYYIVELPEPVPPELASLFAQFRQGKLPAP